MWAAGNSYKYLVEKESQLYHRKNGILKAVFRKKKTASAQNHPQINLNSINKVKMALHTAKRSEIETLLKCYNIHVVPSYRPVYDKCTN